MKTLAAIGFIALLTLSASGVNLWTCSTTLLIAELAVLGWMGVQAMRSRS